MIERITIDCEFQSAREGVTCWADVDMDDVPNIFVKGVEYKKVKFGRWVAVENDLDYYPFMCSECYETVIKKTNRCPRCGVKMEVEENEND